MTIRNKIDLISREALLGGVNWELGIVKRIEAAAYNSELCLDFYSDQVNFDMEEAECFLKSSGFEVNVVKESQEGLPDAKKMTVCWTDNAS